MKLTGVTLAAVLPLVSGLAIAEEFKFDASEFEKKTLEFNGYFEQKEELLKMRNGSSAYKLAYPGSAEESWLQRNTSTLDATGRINLDPFVADLRVQASNARDALVNTTNSGKIMEGGLRWSAGPELTLDTGKRVMRWGKGYAWNPVGFVERPKDPSDPLLAREGYVMTSGEWTRSFSGDPGGLISAVGVTGLVVPTNDLMNPDYGNSKGANPAAKLYLLALDTDIDLMWRGKGAKPESFGFDFSRNINSAMEVHGEWARTLNTPRVQVTADGVMSSQIVSSNSYLLGVRYLTQNDVTWIAEYYRNGNGYRTDELNNYYQFIDKALAPGASAAQVNKATTVSQTGYGKPNPGQGYLYLRASVNEPFNWVYGSVALTAMSNLNDRSWQLTPEINYTGFKNIEIRGRVIFLGGQNHSEFADKAVTQRIEVYARLFF